ncbi:hypothetical protein jhhlp_001457 [Lomentospora prolificans]|uniref:ER membrane protein complex subunit 7 beta-sandwich domain-containing protein n=1 Tax=Lomentospora prolificans TaxID=41688 RepID=A0A2N3NI77_9PEZI|nr:hypothetical protein jhhlp_001457 [Lomentospora prolificans]
MRSLSLSGLTALLLPLASAATVTLYIGPSPHLANNGAGQSSLPASTHATLSTLGSKYSAQLTPSGEFVFRNVSEGSYLGDVHCSTYAFAPVRVDVAEGEGEGAPVVVEAWETYRGNEWGNKGEVVARREGLRLGSLGKGYFVESKNHFEESHDFDGVVDPEMKAEFEERQKTNPMNGLLSGQASGANPMGNFDMAAYLAGSNKKEGNGRGGDNGAVRR